MKKILMTIAAVAFATTMNAQVYLGGSLGLQGGTTTKDYVLGNATVSQDVKTFTFEILPEIGYKINDKMAIGTVIGIDFNKQTTPHETYDDVVKGFYFNFKPYFRYTFVQWDKVSLFADAQVGMRFGKDTHESSASGVTVSYDEKYTQFSFAIVPGIAYQASEKVSVVAKLGNGLGYWHEKTSTPRTSSNGVSYDDQTYTNTYGLNLKTLGLTVGVYYNF
jgi:hypothetical protein